MIAAVSCHMNFCHREYTSHGEPMHFHWYEVIISYMQLFFLHGQRGSFFTSLKRPDKPSTFYLNIYSCSTLQQQEFSYHHTIRILKTTHFSRVVSVVKTIVMIIFFVPAVNYGNGRIILP